MSKLFKKTLIMMTLLFGVVATIISAVAGWILYDRIIDEYKSKAIAIANNIAHSSMEIILNRDASTIQSIVDQLRETKGLSYVLVVNKDGEFLSHTFAPSVPYELRKVVEQPRENTDEVIVTNVRLKGEGNYLDISSPILSGVAGHVHVGMDLDGVMSYMWWTIVKLHAVTFMIFLLSVGIAYVLTNKMSRPLIELTHYANKVANREFSAVVDIRSRDEVGVLARTMTNMASEIESRMETLEREVSEATQELQETLTYVSAISDNLADGLLVIDSYGITRRSNTALVKILELDYDPVGHNVRVLLGQQPADFLQLKGLELSNSYETAQAEQPQRNSSYMRGVEEERDGNTAEFIASRSDGSRFPIELSASVVNMKGIWYTIGIVRDITVRKRAEETLRLSEEKYRGIFEHAVDGIFQTDARGHLVHANPASAHILGFDSPEELLRAGKEMGDGIYLHSGQREEFIRLIRKGQVLHGFEVELRRKDGRPIWASLHARPILNEHGDLVSTEGIVQDVTERKRAQEALLESERRYRELFDISPDPMIVHRGGILFGNAAAARFFRVENTDKLMGLPLLDFIHPEFREVVSKRIQEAERSGVVSDFTEVQLLRADGSVGYLESVALPTTFKGERAVLSLGRDITERREAEEALRTSEERFRTIFEVARDCIFLKDLDLRYTHVNPAVETLFGLPAPEIIGKRSEDFFGPEAASHILEGDLRVLAGETVEDEHTRPVRGMNLTFHDIRTPLRDSAGAVVGVCKFSRNITGRKGVQPVRTFTQREYLSPSMIATLERGRQAAETDGIVLLLGESGTGKDYMARWIHSKSKRADGPFFSVNCAAIPRELAESELFGHERGAFTGAIAKKRGLLELAEGGTLLLNEVGELPLNLQSKLLTFLDTRSFTRVGGEKDIRVHARLIAATHRDLRAEVEQGRFLEALYYRLNVYTVRVPALRERLEDLPVIVEEILLDLATDMRLTQVPAIGSQDMEKLASYGWPGNVRELRNVLERAVMLSRGAKLEIEIPSLATGPREWSHEVLFPEANNMPDIIDQVTRSLCVEALRRSAGNRTVAAELLGISRQSLYRYIKEQDTLPEVGTLA
ncbi:MAG: PAS domain S-box protein [Deltaproteobacteria bacterium]|nr:PAS domain S-box protein [Deltaproteobacteria bacterium]